MNFDFHIDLSGPGVTSVVEVLMGEGLALEARRELSRLVMSDPKAFFWLNGNNLVLMFGILKCDLGLLWPDLRDTINKNYRVLSQAVRKNE